MKTTGERILKREDLVYPELSYQIIGVAFDVYNKLGYGHKESIYQKALAVSLKNANLSFKEQVYSPVMFGEVSIGKNYLDFLIDERVVLEIKRGNYFHKSHIDQLHNYLIVNKLKLGILAYFTPRNVHFKRVVNVI
ncbi:MAG: GxxExxY protein [Candidatus Liptonbacteria bacterium]|nr:GxxExxY protein [Candidatus Liptonbacteria bacterium]